jgi:hypothetical protein
MNMKALIVGLCLLATPALATTKAVITSSGSSGGLVSGNLVKADGTNSATDAGISGTPGNGLQVNSGVLEAVGGRTKFIAGGATITLQNTDCGAVVASNGVSAETVTVPTAPPNGCSFTFKAGLSKTYILFPSNGLTIAGWANNQITALSIYGTIQNTSLQITFDAEVTGAWSVPACSRSLCDLIMPREASILAPNGSYLSHNSGSSRFELFPKNGGGIITNGKMMVVPDAGLYLPDAGTTNSALNYIYAYSNSDSDGVVTGAANSGGFIRLTITHGATTGAQVGLWCYSIGGAIQANGYTTGTVIDSTHIDEAVSSSGLGTYTSGGQCRILELRANTTAPAVIANGVQSMTGDAHYTFVGTASVGASHVINSWTSYFNSQLNTILPPGTVSAFGCNSDLKGARGWVTDASAAVAFNATVTGGGANEGPVACNGTSLVGG